MADHEILVYLQAERARRPDLAETLALHIAMIEARCNSQIQNPNSQPDVQEPYARLERGAPVMNVDELTLDWEPFAHLFQTLCYIAGRFRVEQQNAFDEIASWAQPPARLEPLVREYLRSTRHPSLAAMHTPPTPDAAGDTRFAIRDSRYASLAAFILNNALHPFLAEYARVWQPVLDTAAWYRAYCPICGGASDFAALEKESGARRLLCARCDQEWAFHRSTCPFCGEDAPGKLGYFPSADGAYRLYTCETCKRYIKTIDLRELAREVNLPAERVLTIGMDVAAREAGYG
ncbi:MAG: formate dehydrogenase accessory protein FdhE [Chloroflexi bacterium]|nr:formate dehydrogenase accessory protein FdhE [Chloroflexota bacterium]